MIQNYCLYHIKDKQIFSSLETNLFGTNNVCYKHDELWSYSPTITIYRVLWIGRDNQLNQSKAYAIS